VITEWLRKTPQAVKATLAAMFVLAVVGAAQLWMLRAGVAHWIVAMVPFVVCATIAYLYTSHVVRFRLRNFAAVLLRIADGDLEAELPPAPDSDAEDVRVAFLRMASALRRTTGELRRTDLARRQLFRDLAHELGTPTQTLVALADALSLPQIDADSEQRRALVSALVEDGMRLTRLVGDVRELAELDDPDVSIERVPSELGALIRGAVHPLCLALPDGARVEIETREELPVEVDADRVAQIGVNLVSNALRHAPGGLVRVVVDRDGPWARVTIDDDGEGVPDAMLGRLGERLLRVDASRSRRSGGSGLGLSIVRAIVERHEGELAFERSPLGGLRAVVRLPMAQESGDGSMTSGPPA
jgi:two-component system sensor histidine kinase BaeS